MLKIDVLTLFPNLFEEHINNLPFKRALINEKLNIKLWNLRNYALDSYGTVDDTPYGGGVGMILRIEPIYNALIDIIGSELENSNLIPASKNKSEFIKKYGRVIVLSPRGKTFDQNLAKELSLESKITIICGRYEGIDARVEENYATDVVSVGNYVLSGGELPALVIMESITRLLPGVLQKETAAETESFSHGQNTEYPQYTRPVEFNGFKIPDVLLSGNHKEIEKWRKQEEKNIPPK